MLVKRSVCKSHPVFNETSKTLKMVFQQLFARIRQQAYTTSEFFNYFFPPQAGNSLGCEAFTFTEEQLLKLPLSTNCSPYGTIHI